MVMPVKLYQSLSLLQAYTREYYLQKIQLSPNDA